MRIGDRRGFILFIVIAVLLGLAILAFALNTFKSGAVTQLSRNVDQNRLALIAQSANAEVIATLKSQVNLNPSTQTFLKFRNVFPTSTSPAQALPFTVELLPGFDPQKTVQLAKLGYNLKVRTSAALTVFRRSSVNSMSAYNGYIDVISKAWREGYGEITMEAHERRDVRLIDLRHTLDKYALFVKNYCNDYNNTSRRLIIDGIKGARPHDISRIFLGSDNAPDCEDPRKEDLWFDLCYEEHKDLRGFDNLFAGNALKAFPMAAEAPPGYPKFIRLFYENQKRFRDLGIDVDNFVANAQVVNEYERVMNFAADSCMVTAGVATEPYMTKTRVATQPRTLRAKCQHSIAKLNNENSLAQMMCQDLVDHVPVHGAADDLPPGCYASCSEFIKLLGTCENNWTYRWGYTDAASVWKVDTPGRVPQDSTLPDRYAGLANIRMGTIENYGPYMSEYREIVDGKPYNAERARVGVMQQFYGSDNDTPLLIEGKAYLRFFKIAYLDEFTTPVSFLVRDIDVNIRVISNRYLRKDKYGSYLTDPCNELSSNLGLFSDNKMKSRAIDELTLNNLWGDKIKCYDGGGDESEYDPANSPETPIILPAQRAGSTISATRFGRKVDFQNSSWNYLSATDFMADRAPGDGKILYLDGFMYINNGDLDLRKVTHFQGKGMIYVGRGNCRLGSLERLNVKPTSDSLRIYLHQGDFIIDSSVDDVFIEASLAALYDDPQGSSDPLEQGSVIFNNRTKVTIYGNLLVDSLHLQSSGNSGLADGGLLHIIHDPVIYNPSATIDSVNIDPYHISIGPVKTSFSYRAGGEES